MDWRGISQAELSRRTTITENTIGNIINGNTIGTINNIVLMCLGSHLPWDINKYLIDRSGTKFILTNEDNILYRFALQHMSSKTINEIQSFLQEQGAATL